MRHTKKIVAVALALTASLTLVACGDDDTADTTIAAEAAAPVDTMAAETTVAGPADIVDTAVANGSFTKLAELLTAAGLVETLKGEGPFTVFAPTDDAFAAVPQETLDALAADPAKLKAVLTYHVVSGKVMSTDIQPGDVATVGGPNVSIAVTDGKVTVNDANVVTADVEASNGVIHVIDKVLLPPA